jgi:hypothetical protein
MAAFSLCRAILILALFLAAQGAACVDEASFLSY